MKNIAYLCISAIVLAACGGSGSDSPILSRFDANTLNERQLEALVAEYDETAASNLPTGNATYSGFYLAQTAGDVAAGSEDYEDGDARIAVNFSSGAVQARLDGPLTNVTLNGQLSGNQYEGETSTTALFGTFLGDNAELTSGAAVLNRNDEVNGVIAAFVAER